MNLNKNTVLLIVAVALFGIAGKIILLCKAQQAVLVAANLQTLTARGEMARVSALKQAVFARIPIGNGQLNKIKIIATQGSAALYNMVQAHHLTVSALSIDSPSQGDIALDAIAKSLPLTDGHIRRITLLLKVNFNNLAYLDDFIEAIPASGGYLSHLKIKGSDAALTVKFIGV